MEFLIRTATEDLTDIHDLYRKYENERFLYAGDRFLYDLLGKLEKASILVGELEGKTIGFAYALKHIGKTGWLGGLFVEPNRRWKGIGTKLVRACLEHLSNWGCENSFLFVDLQNKPANCLFKKLGFTLVYQRVELTKKIDLRGKMMPCTLKNVDTNPKFKEVKDIIFNSSELRKMGGSIPLYYYPVVLDDKLLRQLVENGKVIVDRRRNGLAGIAIFQKVPVVRSDHTDLILREKIVKEIQPCWEDYKGEINFITGQEKSVKNLISFILNRFVRREVGELILYSYASNPHLRLLKSENFSESSRRLNVMRYTYT